MGWTSMWVSGAILSPIKTFAAVSRSLFAVVVLVASKRFGEVDLFFGAVSATGGVALGGGAFLAAGLFCLR